jgi:hypothetical protein
VKSLFDQKAYDEVLERIDLLTDETTAQWGKMDVAQMLNHCQQPLAVALGKKTLKKPNLLMKWLFKSFKPALYNDKPWKQSMTTAKEYVVESSCDFQEEKAKLKSMIDEFYTQRSKSAWDPHPTFGEFAPEQWGMMQFKHMDHHLKQFGV